DRPAWIRPLVVMAPVPAPHPPEAWLLSRPPRRLSAAGLLRATGRTTGDLAAAGHLPSGAGVPPGTAATPYGRHGKSGRRHAAGPANRHPLGKRLARVADIRTGCRRGDPLRRGAGVLGDGLPG